MDKKLETLIINFDDKEIVLINKQIVLDLIESKVDIPNLSWTPESFMSFLTYLKETIKNYK